VAAAAGLLGPAADRAAAREAQAGHHVLAAQAAGQAGARLVADPQVVVLVGVPQAVAYQGVQVWSPTFPFRLPVCTYPEPAA
jgi:hypothetical protein